LEGLETIAAQSSAVFNIAQLDALISSLRPRTFLLHNVHAPAPVIFQTRWAMSYLAGPLTRDQIRLLAPRPAVAPTEPAPTATIPQAQSVSEQGTTHIHDPRSAAERDANETTSPASTATAGLPSTIPQYFLPVSRALEDSVAAWRTATGNKRAQFGSHSQLVYRPALVAQALVRYVSARANVNADRRFAFVLDGAQLGAAPAWDEATTPPVDPTGLQRARPAGARLEGDLPAGLADPRKLAAWQKDLVSYLYRTGDFTLHHNPTLKLYARPGQSFEEFRAECQRAAEARRDEALGKVRARYDKRLDTLEDRRLAETREMDRDEDQLRAREAEARWTTAENLLGLALGRRPTRMFSTGEQKKRLAQRARHDVTESKETLAELDRQIAQVKAEAQAEFSGLAEKWAAAAQDIQPLRLTPKRADIFVELFGLGWQPFWQIEADGQWVSMPAFD
jgi:hypothetical protein